MTTQNTANDQAEMPLPTTDAPVDTGDGVDENTPLGVLAERTEAAEASSAPATETVQEQPQLDPADGGAQPSAEEPSPPPATEAAPSTAPVSEAPVQPEPPPVIPDADAIDRQRLDTAERELAQFKEQAAASNLESQVLGYKTTVYQKLMQTGLYTEEQATAYAHEIGDVQRNNFLQFQASEAKHKHELQVERDRYRTASHLSKMSNGAIESDDLLQYDTPQAMQRAVADRTRIAELEARVTKAERGTVQAQSFDSGAQTVTGELSGSELEDAIGNGLVSLTPERIKKLEDYHKSIGVGA